MIYDLVDKNHPLLREKLTNFDFANPPIDPVELVRNLSETMIANKGLGLAANQVGLPHRVFVINSQQIIPCFNPLIVNQSDETVLMEEGCLSHPDLFIKIKRPATIRVRYTLPNGDRETKEFAGITARVFQHELDHLDGICHITRANPIHLEKARRALKKRRRSNEAR